MEQYYTQQAQIPHFSSYTRQRGSGFGALVSGVGRFALPFARKFLVPAAKKLGRQLLMEGIPELADVVAKRKSPKQAVKSTLKKTIRKQVGSGKRRRRSSRIIPKRSNQRRSRVKRQKQRTRADFFSKVKHDY